MHWGVGLGVIGAGKYAEKRDVVRERYVIRLRPISDCGVKSQSQEKEEPLLN